MILMAGRLGLRGLTRILLEDHGSSVISEEHEGSEGLLRSIRVLLLLFLLLFGSLSFAVGSLAFERVGLYPDKRGSLPLYSSQSLATLEKKVAASSKNLEVYTKKILG